MGANHAVPLEAAPPGPAADLRPVEGSWHDFTSLWLPLQDGLFRIALLIAPDRADAEDAVSDTMAATFRPWQRGRVDSLDAYARRALVNRLTGRGRRRSVADRHRRTRSGDSRGAREMEDEVADRDELRRALAELPAGQRATVVLRYYARLSVTETATTLGCTEGTVKSQTHDALATLRARLRAAQEAGP